MLEMPAPIMTRHPAKEKPECQLLNPSACHPSCPAPSSAAPAPQAAATWLTEGGGGADQGAHHGYGAGVNALQQFDAWAAQAAKRKANQPVKVNKHNCHSGETWLSRDHADAVQAGGGVES